ncbi:MAG: peptidase M24 [marine bacterium B5-7]|nr:MAG: peptidase M24 [marine bacterium B5-7]
MTNETLREKVLAPISTSELERRWTAVRDRMKEHKVDFVIAHNHNDYLGGYVKWFTDEPSMHCYPISAIFPLHDEMTTVCHGSSDPRLAGPPEWAMRGVKKRLSAPVMHSLNYAATLDAELLAAELKNYKNARICLVNEAAMTAGFVKTLREQLSSAKFVDITDDIDEIKAIKSDEEIVRIKENALLHDEALRACFEAIEPGVREFEVAAAGRNRSMMLGSEQHIVFVASAPPGTPLPFNMPHAMNKRINKGDQVGILVEVNDASGYYTHLSRIACLGDIPDELQAHHEIALEAQKLSLDMIKPGADPVEILRTNNEYLESRNLPGETRVYAHGQGYDMVERPSFQPGETMKIAANMNIAVHPAANGKRASAILTDNYIVTETGVSECIHKTPKKIFSL